MTRTDMSKLGLEIAAHRKRLGLTQRDLHVATGIEQATISRIERGEMQLVSPHLPVLARELGIEILNPLSSNVEPVTLRGSVIPVWPQAQTARIAVLDEAGKDAEIIQHIMTARKHSARSFAMLVSDDSMLPRFRKGNIVVFDPAVNVEVGKYVVARGPGDVTIFAQYASRGFDSQGHTLFELMPLNALYPSVHSGQVELEVLGVAVELLDPEL